MAMMHKQESILVMLENLHFSIAPVADAFPVPIFPFQL